MDEYDQRKKKLRVIFRYSLSIIFEILKFCMHKSTMCELQLRIKHKKKISQQFFINTNHINMEKIYVFSVGCCCKVKYPYKVCARN